MKITIGIPNYNGAEWLGEAIESALKQTIKCEVICCNDGSTDTSLEICRKYPIKVIDQVNKGLASARNSIIMNAKGDFILFLDSDDVLKENCVERILDNLKEIDSDLPPFTDIDVVALSFKEFGLSDREVILMPEPKLEDFRTGNRLGYCAAIRRSALLEIGGYSPKMVEGYEDLHLTINLLTRGYKLVTIPEVLWQYRIKSESMYTKAIQYHKKLLAQINRDFPQANINF